MIKVGRLKQLLARVPDDASVYAYEGEETGFVFVSDRSDTYGTVLGVIRACEQRTEDTHVDGIFAPPPVPRLAYADLQVGEHFICRLRKPDFAFVKTEDRDEHGNAIARVVRTGDLVPIVGTEPVQRVAV